MDIQDLIPIFEKLTGKKCQLSLNQDINVFENSGLGYSQFNEILILLGFDRISESFFQYLVNGDLEYKPTSEIATIGDLIEGIEFFRESALLFFGNISVAFNAMSKNQEELYEKAIAGLEFQDIAFKSRHEPVNSLHSIPPDIAYLFGYYIEQKLLERIKDNPDDKEACFLMEQRTKYISLAKQNQVFYLTSDHLDVYVATSMREKHEFVFVNDLIGKIFNSPTLRGLKLRWFDPTQSYCGEREDKGLSEALMLKRAKCTLYLVQENDSLGKDSELASTLAQGKPVIAFVPVGDKIYVDEMLVNLKKYHPEKDEKDLILEQLKVFDPSLAWTNKSVQSCLNDKDSTETETLLQLLYNVVKQKYDNRAIFLKKKHPLGIQVNLKSGVANGVLVVRAIKDCVNLIKSVVKNNMEFDIVTENKELGEYIYLQEKISESIFRLQTGDTLLTNSFWNFYLMS